MDFFDFYGTKFNFYSTGISVKNRGSYFSKVIPINFKKNGTH